MAATASAPNANISKQFCVDVSEKTIASRVLYGQVMPAQKRVVAQNLA